MYLLKDRTQIFNVIIDFITKIKTQFSTTICVLCTGKALEYTKKRFLVFVHLMIVYTRLLVLKLHKRMGLLKEN